MSTLTEAEGSRRRLGDFEIVRELGRGGMGVVYEAWQVSLKRRVALKVLSGSLGLTPRAVQRFHREAEAAAGLHHTNIVPVYDIGEQDGAHFYAMELIDGPSLDQVIRRLRQAPAPEEVPSGDGKPDPSPLSVTGPYPGSSGASGSAVASLSSSSLDSGGGYFDAVARMVAEVADALDYAHRQGVVHRDIKPSNLLLSPEGRLSINDFGLARMLEQPGMTMTGEFVGTPAYMSPEQIAAGRTPLDHRTDIYSLGATLYELLTLRPPFVGERRDQVLAQILHKEPSPPRTVNRKVPVDLETICLKALDRDPDRRYQTAGALAEDLRCYLNRFAISARRAGPAERLRKWVKRQPALAAALAALALAILAAGFFAYLADLREKERIAEQQQADEQRREERRRNALDRAMTSAMSGELEKATASLLEASQYGPITGEDYKIRGIVALYSGEAEKAVRELQWARERMPGSKAVLALLGMAYFHLLDLENMENVLRDVQSLSDSAPEDTVFMALLTSVIDPKEGKKLVDAPAFRRDKTNLARAVRAEVLCGNAFFTGTTEDAHAAVAAAEDLAGVLPNNPVALANIIMANLALASARERAGQSPADALGRAEDAATGLMDPLTTSPVAYRALFTYHDLLDRPEIAEKVCRQARDTIGGLQFDIFLADLLYRKGQADEAINVFRSGNAGGAFRDIVLAYCFVDLGKFPQVDDLLGNSAGKRTSMDRLYLYTVPDFVGRNGPALRGFQGIERGAILDWQQGWYVKIHDYCTRANGIDEKLLLDGAADRSKGCECEAHFFVGMRRLGEGDRQGAREHFEASVATRILGYHDYRWSRAFLGRMRHNRGLPHLAASTAAQLALPGGFAPLLACSVLYPEWPHWIPLTR